MTCSIFAANARSNCGATTADNCAIARRPAHSMRTARIKAERDAFVRFLQDGAWRSDPARRHERIRADAGAGRVCARPA